MAKRKTPQFIKDFLIIKTLFLTITGLLLTISMFSQQNDLVLKAEELVYSNPDEAIKIANHILSTNQDLQQVAIANLLLVKSFLVKGDYKNALIYAFDEKNQLTNVHAKTRIENYILKATLLRKLYLDSQSKEYLNKASILTSRMSDEKNLFEFYIFLENTNMLLDRLQTNEAMTSLEEAEIQFKSFLQNNTNEKRAFFLDKERAFNSLSKYDSAFVYMNKTLELLDSSLNNNVYEKAIIYKESGLLYLQKKEFEQSKEMLFIAIRFAEIIDNSFLLEQINRDLSINYLASNQTNQHKVYYEEFVTLNSIVENIEQEAVNAYYKIMSNREENELQAENKKYTNYLYISLATALFIMIIGILVLLKSENRKKRKKEIISYLELSRNNFTKVKPAIKKASKRIVIPEETERAILSKLKRFEASQKYLNKDMSLAVLSGQFETNTKYLSEIINKHYNDNFNTFINKLRINYIIKKLRNDSNYAMYKISFLAEDCGFSSHSNFATVFKTIVGMSPATFINLLKKEKDEIKKKESK